MAGLLNVDRVQYECDCGEQMPLCRLYFCRHCSQTRCPSCASTEIDCMFCPNCLENIPLSEARVKRNRCFTCNMCPICSMTLSARQCTDTQATYMVCATCRWSSRDSDLPDQMAPANWPVHENPLEGQLNQVLDQLKAYELAEKAQRDQSKFSKRRSNVGSMFSDRFGLQAIYQKRKQAMEKPKQIVEPHAATGEVSPLDESVFTLEGVEPPSLDSIIMQPLAATKKLGVVHMPLRARKATRCKVCEHNLSKLDYSPSSIKFKIQYFGRNVIPEIRLSRETQLMAGQTSSVFLTVINHSQAKTDVIVIGDPQDDCVECLTPVVEFLLQNVDETTDVYSSDAERPILTEGNDPIVFRRKNRVGIRIEVKLRAETTQNILALVVKYKTDLSVMSTKEQAVEWKIAKIRVQLGKS